ncbi:MAG: helix-turn-helix transcriptional regulator [Alphaproteobacteria bacterium]|nr:helix-turn-helix transcriptional regulator [Alphaproteobacteria bacterium]MCW5743722.1 helix-turn-helix transcriptional regulator [Alphaproteobacteria bacterium]
MLELDMALRGGAVGLLGLVMLLLPRGAPRAPAAWIAAAYSLTIAAYCVVSAPGLGPRFGLALMPLAILAHSAPVAFWLMARAFFEDGFRPRGVHAAMIVGWIVVALIYWLFLWPMGNPVRMAVDLAIHAVAAGFVVLSLLAAIRGAPADLVERRRRLRPVFVAMSGLYMLVVLVLEVAMPKGPAPAALSALNAAGIFAVVFAFSAVVLGLGAADLFVQVPRNAAQAPAEPAIDEPPAPAVSVDTALLDKIRTAMERDRLYREEGLTIAVFAMRLGATEHRVRRAINAGLGHRNFNMFLNAYRIADARAALADPSQAEVPVLTIAMDAGFGSLGPFNRAFKAETGLTPSEFRARAAAT